MTMIADFDQRLGDLADRGSDELGGIVGDGRVEPRRQLLLYARHEGGDAVDHGQRIGFRRAVDADEHGLETVEHRRRIRGLRSELDLLRDVPKSDQRVAVSGHHELAEGLRAVEGGQRVDADLGEVALHLARGGGEIVGRERRAHIVGRHPLRRHTRGIEPDAHRENLAAEKLRVRDAIDGLQAGLDDAGEIVGDLRRRHHVGIEAHVHERKTLSRLLDDDGIIGLARQEATHLVDLGQRVRHRPVGIGVEPQVERDRRDVLLRTRHQRVDALRARHRLFDRRGYEALDHVGGRARIGRGDGDRRVRGLRKLADLELVQRHQPDQQDEQAHHARQHRPADEEIGEGVHRALVLTAGASRRAAEGPAGRRR